MGRGGSVALLVACGVAGCGGSSHSSSSSAQQKQPSTQAAIAPSTTSRQRTTTTETALNARIPATFTIGTGTTVRPPTVSVPAKLPVALTVSAADGRAHRVSIAGAELSIPPGGRATKLITGLKAGRYQLEVDGKARGALVIGAQPGP